MSEQATRGIEEPEPLALTRAVVRYRDSVVVLLDALRRESAILRRAGFRPYVIRLRREDGRVVEANLWTQDAPRLTDFLNAGLLLFGDVPGSLWWESSSLGA
jgi:hypothetical protein